MKITIVSATGKAGSRILKEAVNRGHTVTAIVRDQKKVMESGVAVVVKNILDLGYDDLRDSDVVIDAFGTFAPDKLDLHQTTLRLLADLLSGKPNRLLVVGGAGSLYVNPERTVRLMDTPDFPESFKPLAAAMGKAFAELKNRSDVKWTYLSPPADFVADGPRTGKYRAGGDELLVNAKGESTISYADYAIAMIDEAENGSHIGKRFTVAGE